MLKYVKTRWIHLLPSSNTAPRMNPQRKLIRNKSWKILNIKPYGESSNENNSFTPETTTHVADDCTFTNLTVIIIISQGISSNRCINPKHSSQLIIITGSNKFGIRAENPNNFAHHPTLNFSSWINVTGETTMLLTFTTLRKSPCGSKSGKAETI